MKIAKSIKTILCDDVRQEVGGKISLMGVYSKDIVVKKVPVILPSINFVIFFEDIKESFDKIFVKIDMPKSDPINIIHAAPSDLKKGKNVSLILGLVPFKINGTGSAKFEIRFAEDEKASVVHHFSINENKNN